MLDDTPPVESSEYGGDRREQSESESVERDFEDELADETSMHV